ncbi:ISAs1 family transposase [Hymenobacter sp. NST-14]|uniref:ISAs1 family transposase n=1 Tax=Hymenobacter piscis TaxID=2839984 RepID=UPI001C02B4B2|nr:ISAs1 family transposase [Hymenobacter piscis]MBT9395660.1 ISAs1 family transposase [Hymenobacter piscis]
MDEAVDFFEEVTDFREQGRCRHELSDIIWLVLCGLLADCETFEDIYDYACDKETVLRAFLALPAGIPSHDTLNRVFRYLDPVQLESCLTRWGAAIVGQLARRQLIVDGKQLRGTTPAGRRQAPVQLVSVWAAAQRLCLAQTPVAEKSSEATAMPQVLEAVDVAGSVVSLDALGTQPALAARLLEREADYVLALKQNQRELFTQVQAHFAPLLAQAPAHTQADKGHGRGEQRRLWVSRSFALVDAADPWPGLCTLVCVQTTRWQHGHTSQATRYYLSSLAEASAAELAGYIRGHWGIENHQHWHLDVTWKEDGCHCRRDHAPRNLSTLRKLALSLLQREQTVMSLRRKRKKAARDDQFLWQVLSQLDPQPETVAS